MTESLAAQEDQLELPAPWESSLLPRRGLRAGEPVAIDPEAAKVVRGLTKWHQEEIRTALASPDNADYAAAGLRHLASIVDGDEPDAFGAGVIAVLLSYSDKRKSPSLLRPELDHWVTAHGVAFAAEAALVRLSTNSPTGRYHWNRRHTTVAECTIAPSPLTHLGSLSYELDSGIAALRGLLAAAPEDEYAAAVAGVGALRTDPTRRLIATILFPEQAAWAEEVCAESAPHDEYFNEDLLWRTVERPDLLTAAGLRKFGPYRIDAANVGAVLANLGPRALPFLTATLGDHLVEEQRRLLLEAVALIPTDEAAAYLLDDLAEPFTAEYAAALAARFPGRTLRLVAAKAPAIDPELRPVAAALLDRVPEARLAALDADARGALAALRNAAKDAPAADLPALLTSPPWTVKRPKAKTATVPGLTAPDGTGVVWAEGERERWSQTEYDYFKRLTVDDWHKRIRSLGTRDRGSMLAIALTYAPVEVAATALDKWQGEIAPYTQSDLKVVLSRFEDAAADRLVDALRANPVHHEALVPVRSAAAARLAADWFARLRSARATALAWIDRHGAEGARLLVPDALGEDRKARRNAEGLLSVAVARIGAPAVAAAAETYGPEAAQAIRGLLDGDPLEPRGVKVPRPGAWAEPALLPQVLLADGERALPAASVKHLITVLALATPDYPYAGLDVVAETCDRASLARFSRALFQRWIACGAPAKDGWALTQLAHFADEDTVRLLAPKVRDWPGRAQHKRAVTGLGVLGAIGTESALRAIQGIADKVKFKALKVEAGVQITAIAAELGLSREQLADRLVPDFGLGDGPLVLDYGPRRFTVGFDEHLKPFVADEDGKPRKALPKPGAKDDPESAGAAYQRFSQLKKDLRTASADQVARLELAMTAARSWTVEEFRTCFAEHPLVKHLARRLVWTAETGAERVDFRIAEDGTYSDAAEDEAALPESATIRLAHPIRMSAEDLAAWSQILADYEILQPFEQLTRPVMAFTKDELATGHLARFEGAEVEVGRVLGLTKRGWQRGEPQDGGVEPGVYLALAGGGYVTLSLDPGIWVGMVGENPVQTFVGVRLADSEAYDWYGAREDRTPPPAVDALTASEILVTLTRLTGRS
ncbi:DUF4132 domain-containing protein [Glycomyces paridis]|uniref:DUF4132 domain-containing protein n=1 Tax=Glycomyces paridis TaxID=2126555 RepID=A0A4S8PKU4_9ACTN|nr:DUF4132 domain-containing protein [Glycomyces paridis]THV30701.1 DUF4132 domain-containing protein [Glycomyces paridis]